MDKATKIMAASVIGMLVVGVSYVFLFNRLPTHNKPIIGLVYIPTISYHEIVNNSLIEAIQKSGQFITKEFAIGSMDSILANATCKAAIESDVNIIIVTGIFCSQILTQASKNAQSRIPILFLGVTEPVAFELVSSQDKLKGNATGLWSTPISSDLNLVDLLLSAKKHTRNILLPYATSPNTSEEAAKQTREHCTALNVQVTLLPIDNINDTLIKVTSLIAQHDAMMYFETDAVGCYASALGKLASQHNVTMVASTIEGVQDAALSYAPNPVCLADVAFSMAKQILIDGKRPSQIPVQEITVGRYFRINTALCDAQDLNELDTHKLVTTIENQPKFATVRDHIIIK